jgi:plasmid stabilization system protein ParE
MKTYRVVLGPLAAQDLRRSFEWGVEHWGFDNAEKWFHHLHEMIIDNLSIMPLACPVAPETEEFEHEVRHLIIGRYRALFTVEGDEVFVTRVAGPFTGRPEA